MQLSAYEIALIGVGSTILGALVGALVTYRFSLAVVRINAKIDAGAKLRAAFAPEMAEMRLSANGQKKVDVDYLLSSAFPRHETAIEEFRAHVPKKKKEAYQKAWEKYYTVAGSIRFFNYHPGEEAHKLFFERVHAILQFTEPF